MLDWLRNFGASRFFSLVIAAVYLSVVLFMPGHSSFPARIGAVLLVAAYLLIPVLCIWFGDEMGGFVGALPHPNKQTPGCFVRIGGWVLLLFPVIVLVIRAAMQ
jgi:uncharacterized membrane protein YoaT (DUF817 family)